MGSGASSQNQVQSYDSNVKKLQSETGPIAVQKNDSHDGKPRRAKSANKSRDSDKESSLVSQTPVKSIDSSVSQTESATGSKGSHTKTESKDVVKRDELFLKIKQLEKELATSESKKLDLQEKIQLLEERLERHPQQQQETKNFSQNLNETLHAKDQYISKLEKDSQTAQSEANKLRLKLKKRIRGLTNQLQEVRQEASITQMELRGEINRLNDKLHESNPMPSKDSRDTKKESSSLGEDGGGHSKIIVELSNQLSEQSDQISDLLIQVSQKDKRIEELEAIIKKSNASSSDQLDPDQHGKREQYRNLSSTSTDRLHSSRGLRPYKQTNSEDIPDQSKEVQFTRQNTVQTQSLERQSTALSDSDSDWEIDSIPSHTRSAPTRSRVKSAFSIANSENHKGSLVTLNGDDDSILETSSKSPIGFNSGNNTRQQMQKKSALKCQLEKNRNAKQSHSLMGPSLAFVKKTDQFSDTSCEPTPRYPESRFSTQTRVKTVKPIN